MALANGYLHVESTKQIMYENAGDLTVAIDKVMWMKDHILEPPSYVSVMH